MPMIPKMLIVSSYRRPCGIAQYVEHLEPELRKHDNVEIEIEALPVNILRGSNSNAKKMANKYWDLLLEKIPQYDMVNVQLEPGLFGVSPFLVWKRLKGLFKKAKKIIITYHTVLDTSRKSVFLDLLSQKLSARILVSSLSKYRIDFLYKKIISLSVSNPEKFIHILQTKRDADNLALFGIDPDTIFHHPLAFISEESKRFFSENKKEHNKWLKEKLHVPGNSRLIGCFGFIAEYKGVETAIQAISLLPRQYHLLVVGGLHLEGIVPGTIRQPYMETILKAAKKEAGRIHFLGAPDNEAFNRIMNACDAVVLPYAEVGQTSSGPAALALDMQQQTYCTRNLCFLELNKYHPGILSFFEIGNYMELGKKILLSDADSEEGEAARADYSRRFNVKTRAGLYVQAAKKMMQ